MISFTLSIIALIIGYFLYGRFVERVFGPDDRVTPAVSKADGLDYIVMPGWKIFMIQFLNIAGTGPIFGAIMGAKFGPVAYLWIVFGCIFAGAVHDYFSGMLSMRHDGAGLPEMIGHYLGKTTKNVMLVFTVLLLIVVGAVFVYSPAEILHSIGGDTLMWIIIIFCYYFIATMLPIDKIIGKVYPLFAMSLLFMAGALMVWLIFHWPTLPELWTHYYNMGAATEPDRWTDNIFPALFITIACGAISGFHATQSPLMARCIKNERLGRPVFYGAMICEGIVALIWAAVSSWVFFDGGLAEIGAANTSAPEIVKSVAGSWLGVFGGILALLGVVAAPITSGDTAFRSARLIIADFLRYEQKPMRNRLIVSIPLFALAGLLLWYNIAEPGGFGKIWSYFGWANQTLAVFALWTITVYLTVSKPRGSWYFLIGLVPAVFMTAVSATYIAIARIGFNLPADWNLIIGCAAALVSLGLFIGWHRSRKDA